MEAKDKVKKKQRRLQLYKDVEWPDDQCTGIMTEILGSGPGWSELCSLHRCITGSNQVC